jgi:hypothetical protein
MIHSIVRTFCFNHQTNAICVFLSRACSIAQASEHCCFPKISNSSAMMTPHKKTISRNILIAFLLTWAQTAFLRCEAFQNLDCNKNGKVSIFRHKTACNVLAEPPRDLSAYGSQGQPRNSKRPIRTNPKIRRNRKDDVWSSGRWDRATLVESRLLDALAALQESIRIHEGPGTNLDKYPLQFPDIRECNSALASFGDGGDLLRAMRLYFKMRKTASLSKIFPARNWQPVPTPTLVTFSTMMSRAVHAGKPLLAIRMWKIMRHQPDFFSSESSVPNSSVSPRMRFFCTCRSS